MSGRSPGPQVSVVSALRALVTIFPHQHPRTSAWLAALGELDGDAVGTPPKHEPPRGQDGEAKKVRTHTASTQGNCPGRKKPRATPTVPPSPQGPPLSPPAHARLLRCSLGEWKECQKGLQLSYAKEKDLRAEIRRRADIANGSEGFNEAMLAVGYDLDCGGGCFASVEIFAPRVQNVAFVLVGAGAKGSPKQYFELDFDKLSPAVIREIGAYVLDTGRPQP